MELTGDLYIQNVSNRLGDPIKTSIKLYEEVTSYIEHAGRTDRYGEISYVIVTNNTNSNKENYIAFVSFENTIVHDEVSRFLSDFHFHNTKVDIKVNSNINNKNKREENRRKFKKTINRHLKNSAIKRTSMRDQETDLESDEINDQLYHTKNYKRIKIEKKDEDSNDSFTDIIVLDSNKKSEQTPDQTSEKTEQTSEKTPDQTSKKTPDQTSEQTSEQASKQTETLTKSESLIQLN